MKRITVLGAGTWGLALAKVLWDNGHQVTLWSNMESQVQALRATRTNPGYLPGFRLPEPIAVTADLAQAVGMAEAVVMVVPSPAVRSVAHQLQGRIPQDALLINAAKGFEKGTLLRLSQVIAEELPGQKIVVLSGPSHAEEVSKGMPTTIVAACPEHDLAVQVQDLFINSYFRVYTNEDMTGVEIAAATKNIIALGAGIAAGLGYGDNAKAALITRGLAEIFRLGVAMGAEQLTFAGLAGVGDLIVTCSSEHSRNRRAGILIGQGKTMAQAVQEVGMVVEGIDATEIGHALALKYQVDMPITDQIYDILFNGVPAVDAMAYLMGREKRKEDLDIK